MWREGDTVRVGELAAHVWETPGHCARPHRLLVRGRPGALCRRHAVHARLRPRAWKARSPRCGARSRGSPRCRTRRGSIAGHDYVLSNARFALAVEPGQRGARRPARPKRSGRRRKAASSCPRPSARRRRRTRSCAPASPRSRARSRWRAPTRRGVPGAARMEEQVLTRASAPGRDLSAAEVVRLLDLRPHPEGGHYRETFRDAQRRERARRLDRDLLSPRRRRDLAMAPGRRGRDLAFLRRRAARDHDLAERTRCRGAPSRAGSGAAASARRSSVPADAWQTAASLAPGRSSAARSRPASCSPASRWRRPGWRPTARRAGSPVMTDFSLVQQLETRLINAWPSFECQLADGWILRFAKGYSKRANAATPLDPGRLAQTTISSTTWCASSSPQKIRPTLPARPRSRPRRRRRLAGARLRGDRADSAWSPSLPTFPPTRSRPSRGLLEPQVDPRWVREAAASAYGGDKSDDSILIEIVSRIRQNQPSRPSTSTTARRLGPRRRRARLCRPLRHRREAGPARHRPGPARWSSSLMAWGRAQGAHAAYLQVREENEVARALYRSLGFSDAYRYTHRVHAAGRRRRRERSRPARRRR